MDVLQVRGLCKSYPGFSLREVSFSVQQGRIMGFIGRNGAGKTTTMKCLLNMVHPTAGEIWFFGKDFLSNETEIKEQIGFVSGGINSYSGKKLRSIAGCVSRFYAGWDDAAYRGYLQRFALDEGKTPAQLSAGMQVKFSLALALSHKARLLLLDEPTSGLDPVSRNDLLDALMALCRDEGVSIFFSTHITTDLEKCADDITYMQNGKIIHSGELAAFTGSYRLVRPAQKPDEAVCQKLIGLKPAKTGFTAVVRVEDARELGLVCEAAGLEDIMVHFEHKQPGAAAGA